MLTPQEITQTAQKLAETMNTARSLGNDLTSIFSILDRSATELKAAGIEMHIHFNDKPELQAAWLTYKNATNEPALPHILRTASG